MRLAAVALAVAVVLAGIGALLLARDYDDTLLRARIQVEADARAASADAGQLLSGRLDVVRALAADPQIASGDVDGVEAALAGLEPAQLGLTGGVAYFDLRGSARAMTGGRAKASNARNQSFHKLVLATQQPFISEAVDSRAFSSRAIVLAVPARDSDGRLTGVLAGALRLDQLARTIAAIEHDADSRILLVDRAGLLIAAPGLAAPADVSRSPFVRAARTSGQATAQGSFQDATGLQGTRHRLVGWAWSRDAGWTLLLERPSEVGPARWQLALGLAALLALLALGGAGILALGRRYDFLAREQRRARELAEVRQRRAERLGALSDRLTLAVDGQDVEHAALELGLEAVGADSAVIVVRAAGNVVVRSSRARPDGVRQVYRLTERLPGIRSLEERQGVWVESLEQIERDFPGLREAAPMWRAAAALPLVVGGEVVASLVFGFERERAFDAEERSFQLALASQCAQALERARLYEHEHAIAVELQQSLLPQSLPTPPGVTIETVYRPGNEELAVGGDWYDAVELPDGRVVLTVGDVVGHGLRAAAVMGQLRSAIATLAHVADGPAQLLQRLDSFAARTEGADCATLVCAYLDPATGVLRYASAGHPPPVVVDASGAACLWGGRSTPLAVGEEHARTEETARLAAGATVVLYSDGLVERRGESIEAGIERLTRRVEELVDEGTPELAADLVAGLLDEDGQADDVALLVMRLERITAPAFLVRFAPDPAELRHLRDRLAAWLDGLGVAEADARDLVLATHEAAANSVEHGYGDGAEGDIVVEAAHVDGEVRVSVRDRGSWTEGATSTDRGRGLLLIRSVSDDLVVEREPTGTTVSFRRSVMLADRSA
jgi:serine phosphatase RsbU (regulator of sigma subunit)/anti-sigma regulatory factor (Ser/Thr protein kinase)